MATEVKAWNKPYELDEGGLWRTLVMSGQCAWTWATADGAAVMAIVSPVCVNGDIYLTTIEGRAKTNRLLKDPRCAVAFHHETGSVTAIGHVEFDLRPEVEVMFLQGLQERVFGNKSETHEPAFIWFKHMHSPDRMTCKFIPERYVTYDEEKLLAD
ncbi:MAG TPA: hypothetical protein QGF35_01980 [Dehalococcoidia bacterium]|jgi:hypothetical protein|nr:hypothetical protein [Dehalococcoidia bacterium]